MNEDYRLSKVEILFHQKKFKEAENTLSDLLSEDSNNIHYLSLLAEIYLRQDKNDLANSIIDRAIGLSPDTPNLFYIKSLIAIQQERLSDAENHINQAIKMDPYDADYFALLAKIKLDRKQFDDALETANQALAIDAENLLALNTRSTTLIKLNRTEESFETIEGALRNGPNNAYTHSNYGWVLLEKGEHKKAREHFKEALMNDPTFNYAQIGMIEALKATNPVYRIFLQYSFWMSKLTSKYQWGVIIGFYIVYRLLRSLAQNNEALQPYLTPLIILLALMAFSTWVITPISNLFLRFNKYGQSLLDKKEKMSSNFVASSLRIFAVGILLYFTLSDVRFLTIAFFGFAMMLPLSLMFSPSKYKNAFMNYSLTMAFVGIIGISLTFITDALFNMMSVIFIFGFIGFQLIANFLLIKESNQ